MRKVKLAMYVSVDGVVESPAWTGPFWNETTTEVTRPVLGSRSYHRRLRT